MLNLLKTLEELDFDLAPLQMKKILEYIDLLKKWNKVYNLTAITNTKDILIKHILDCIIPLINLYQIVDKSSNLKILDVGSGAGLPAIIWSIINPNWYIHSIDCVQKKIAFQKQAKIDLELNNLFPHHSRIEDFKDKFNIITARAYANSNEIIKQTKDLLAPNAFYFLLKGKEKELINYPCTKEEIDVYIPYLKAERHILYLSLT